MSYNNYKKGLIKKAFLVMLFFVSFTNVYSQKQYKAVSIAFYNLENLFDTIAQPNDKEFTPQGSKVWNSDKYYKKLNNIAEVISKIGSEKVPGGPYVIGVTEIENINVLEDLVNMPELKPSKYKIVHYDSPDRRGIDVALLYREDFFKVTNSWVDKFVIPEKPGFKSRDNLVVTGLLDGDKITFIVNHWPSRRGGEKRSLPGRVHAAKMCRNVVDSLQKLNAETKVIIMGDLNDNPDNVSMTKYLRAKGSTEKLSEGDLYNPFYSKYKKGIGTTAYRDTWSVFDNIILSQGLLGKEKSTYKFWKAVIFNDNFLKQKQGKYEGYPLRTYSGNTFLNGYSDHFPVYIYLIKEINN